MNSFATVYSTSLEVTTRKDRYNPKLMKYYVVYKEDDEEISEDEETRRHESQEASSIVQFLSM